MYQDTKFHISNSEYYCTDTKRDYESKPEFALPLCLTFQRTEKQEKQKYFQGPIRTHVLGSYVKRR